LVFLIPDLGRSVLPGVDAVLADPGRLLPVCMGKYHLIRYNQLLTGFKNSLIIHEENTKEITGVSYL
jgi:hypothetical protein